MRTGSAVRGRRDDTISAVEDGSRTEGVIRERRAALVVAAVVALPLLVTIAVLRSRAWYPSLDVAMAEFRVRDVFSTHPPLIGLPGRFGQFNAPGSHPGPLGFYLLAPFYFAFGGSTWALAAATVLLHLSAIGLALWIGWRRGALLGVVSVAAVLSVVLLGFGQLTFTQPWNPYEPVLAWVLVVLAVWSVLRGDLRMIFVAVPAASLCAQSHISFAAVALAVLLLGTVIVFRTDRRLGAGSLALAALLWVPVLVDQVRNRPGNLRVLYDHLSSPDEPLVGPRSGLRLLLSHFDLVGFFAGEVVRHPRVEPSWTRGLVVVLAWMALAAWAWRGSSRDLRALHVVLFAASIIGGVSAMRIIGPAWPYLTLWAWAIAVLAAAATVWSAVTIAADRWPRRDRLPTTARVVMLAAAALCVVVTTVATVAYARPEIPDPGFSELAEGLASPTASALDEGVGVPPGERARYTMRIYDDIDLGSVAFGLLGSLERRGLDVTLEPSYQPLAGPNRVRAVECGGVQLVVATGAWVERWRDVPDATEVAFTDPRSDAERAEFEQLRDEARRALVAAGRADLAEVIDVSLLGLLVSGELPPNVSELLDRMLDLGRPAATFVAPIAVRPPPLPGESPATPGDADCRDAGAAD